MAGLVVLGAQLAVDAVADGHGGFEYRHVSDPLPDGGSPAPTEADCLPGDTVIGGGVGATGQNEDVEVSQTSPDTHGGDDVWSGTMNNSSGHPESIFVVAICAQSGRYKERQAVAALPVGEQVGRRADCPSGAKVIGGGVSTSGHNQRIEISATFPADGPDSNSRRDDAWFGSASNDSGAGQHVAVFAICAAQGKYTYLQDSRPLPDETVSADTVPCPSGTKVTGGGIDITPHAGGDPFGREIGDTLPRDLGDGDHRADDAWSATGINDGVGEGKTMTTFAICKE